MGLQLARAIVLPDVPLDWVTFDFGGIDRIDITALGNDVRVELRPPGQPWRTGDPVIVQADTFESINGLATAYKPRGVDAFRIYNATPGKQASARVKAYSVS